MRGKGVQIVHSAVVLLWQYRNAAGSSRWAWQVTGPNPGQHDEHTCGNVLAAVMVMIEASVVAGYSGIANASDPPQVRIFPVSYITALPFAELPPGRVPAVSTEPCPAVSNQCMLVLGPAWNTAWPDHKGFEMHHHLQERQELSSSCLCFVCYYQSQGLPAARHHEEICMVCRVHQRAHLFHSTRRRTSRSCRPCTSPSPCPQDRR